MYGVIIVWEVRRVDLEEKENDRRELEVKHILENDEDLVVEEEGKSI